MAANNDNDFGSERKIRELVLAIRKLMHPNQWVSWRKVAKELEGSEVFEPILRSQADMDKWKHLFVNYKQQVKLSEAGLRFADSAPIPTQTRVGKIAQAVKYYAAGLDRITLKIERICKVARVGRKVVQVVYVDLTDQLLPSETPVEFRPR